MDFVKKIFLNLFKKFLTFAKKCDILVLEEEVRIKLTKLDYSLQSPEDRKALVEQILAETPDPTPQYLETLADYLILCMEKQERKEKKILTDNRLITVNRRETSFEGLVSQFENGEDGIYNLITNDKHTIFKPKISITKQDIEDIPLLKQLKHTIDIWENELKTANGREAYIIKKALIEMRKEQYIIKNAYKTPINTMKLIHSKAVIPLDDKTCIFDDDGYPIPDGVSLLDPRVCAAVLQNYSKLKEDSWDCFDSDMWYLVQDFDLLADKALAPYPLYYRLVEYKIDGKSNLEI